MSGGRKQRTRRATNRRVSVRGLQRENVDVTKLSRAIIALVQADAETQARKEHEAAAAKDGGRQ